MKLIEKSLLSTKYADHFAIYFTRDGIIVDRETSSPILHFGRTAKKLEIMIEAAFWTTQYLSLNVKIP